MAKKDKAHKQLVQQERSGVFRDKKRRMFYIEPKSEEGYQILSAKDSFIYIYDGRALFTLLPLALTHAFVKMNTLLMGIVSLIIYYGITFYFKGKVLPSFKKVANLPQEVVLRNNSVEVLNSRKSDLLLKSLMGVLIIIIIMTNSVQLRIAEDLTTMQTAGISLSMFVAILILFDTLSDYFKVRKLLKNK